MGSACGGGWFFCSRGLYLGGQAGGPNGGAVWEDGDIPSVGVTVLGGGWVNWGARTTSLKGCCVEHWAIDAGLPHFPTEVRSLED